MAPHINRAEPVLAATPMDGYARPSSTPAAAAALAIFEPDGESASAVAERIVAGFGKRTDVDPRFRAVIRMRRRGELGAN